MEREDVILGFLDQTSPQSGSCTARLWSLGKPRVSKNTNRVSANVFGFYSLNGKSHAACYPDMKKHSLCDFLHRIREENPQGHILIVLDNARIHKCLEATTTAWELDISFLYLPPYSPHLNPIEKIWKLVKRRLTPVLEYTSKELAEIITDTFNALSKTNTRAKKWIRQILENQYKNLHNYDQLYK